MQFTSFHQLHILSPHQRVHGSLWEKSDVLYRTRLLLKPPFPEISIVDREFPTKTNVCKKGKNRLGRFSMLIFTCCHCCQFKYRNQKISIFLALYTLITLHNGTFSPVDTTDSLNKATYYLCLAIRNKIVDSLFDTYSLLFTISILNRY